MRSLAILSFALVGCLQEPTHIVVREITDPKVVSIDGISFNLPAGIRFKGDTANCPGEASDCPLADDSTHLTWRADQVRLVYMVDHYAEVLVKDEWGEPVTINAVPAYRKRLPDGSRRYLVTNHVGGPSSAAVAIWKQPETPIFWGQCGSEAGCSIVLQTLASVKLRGAEEECRMSRDRFRSRQRSADQRDGALSPPSPTPPSELGRCTRWRVVDA